MISIRVFRAGCESEFDVEGHEFARAVKCDDINVRASLQQLADQPTADALTAKRRVYDDVLDEAAVHAVSDRSGESNQSAVRPGTDVDGRGFKCRREIRLGASGAPRRPPEQWQHLGRHDR